MSCQYLFQEKVCFRWFSREKIFIWKQIYFFGKNDYL